MQRSLVVRTRTSYKPLPAERANEIRDLAECVSEEYFPTDRVDPAVILNAKDVTLVVGNYDDTFDGLLEWDGSRFCVYCNLDRVDSRSSPRATFTLGHELGHYFIDEHRRALLAGHDPHGCEVEFLSGNAVEQEADLFASHLLMPTRRFAASAKRLQVGVGAFQSLASDYGTSITSVAIRYTSLGISPCVVIKWSDDGYEWKWLSPQAHRAKYWKTVEAVDALPTDSPTAKALRASPSVREVYSGGSIASTWFKGASARRDIILREEAVRLGRFGALTLLFPDSGSFDR